MEGSKTGLKNLLKTFLMGWPTKATAQPAPEARALAIASKTWLPQVRPYETLASVGLWNCGSTR